VENRKENALPAELTEPVRVSFGWRFAIGASRPFLGLPREGEIGRHLRNSDLARNESAASNGDAERLHSNRNTLVPIKVMPGPATILSKLKTILSKLNLSMFGASHAAEQ
jgi:hypothetical protein